MLYREGVQGNSDEVSSCLFIESTSGKSDVCGYEETDEGVDSDEEADSEEVTSCDGSLVMI